MIKILQSKFSIKQVILIPVTVILFVCFLLSILTFFSIDMTYDGTPLYKTPIWAVLIFILLLFFQIRFYLKTFKRYNFFDKGFEIRTIYGKEFYAWNVINQVSLINTPIETILWLIQNEDALVFEMKDGQVIKMFSKYYKNMPAIRKYIDDKNDLQVVNNYQESNDKGFKPFEIKTFKGVLVLTFKGFILIFMSLLFSILFLEKLDTMTIVGIVFIVGIITLLIGVLVMQGYYFQLNKKSLIIRNHVFFHLKHQIDLNKVRVIYFEQKYKKEPSIRIITNDYSMVSFQSISVKNKQWKALISELKKHGLNVVDELFYENK